jgi:2-C-methyl-D-erythritol 4-phosphate cytidylyltransferase / 2-C-methyl-D-erythritol 2,4-cyclodiphosphate synthase
MLFRKQKMSAIAIIVAAGSGSRAGEGLPKQFRMVVGKPLLLHSCEVFASHHDIGSIIVVVADGQQQLATDILKDIPELRIVTGGATRQQSVRNALEFAKQLPNNEYVMIHDAARPFLASSVISSLLGALETCEGAVPTLPVVDSIARGNNIISSYVDRSILHRIQTPQAFRLDAIWDAHQKWAADEAATDDASMAISAGYKVAIVAGDEKLAKFTTSNDFEQNERESRMTPDFRVGIGYDVHRLVAGESLWLCGVKLDYSAGLSGHSDADVALHALTDAMLGALALGDIGDHFPPSDPQWRGASSDQFARHAAQLAQNEGYLLSNVDITIICEAPKIGPHRDKMRTRVADILNIDLSRVSIKATTTEGLGVTGRKEGIAAQAAVCFVSKNGG